MQAVNKLILGATVLVASVAPSFAFWECSAPEIDAAAGISAMALLVSTGLVAYQRSKQ